MAAAGDQLLRTAILELRKGKRGKGPEQKNPKIESMGNARVVQAIERKFADACIERAHAHTHEETNTQTHKQTNEEENDDKEDDE